ncbi:unnamed protein product [Rotaria sp. Silwood1]|nr:unnamed protein product [Rotaria sp. Silwood1]CAF1670050.1 unnamed protein product [Rotaria sp. Silwood1]CAF3801978.1 unnamed protein product [Rotaria sp. Silwood1]CAF4863828.1 unnamed protein product [Rotaria sp. Silwood1]
MELKNLVIIIGGGWSEIGVAGSLVYNRGGHSSTEISIQLTDAGFHVTIVHRGGQYFMRQYAWTPYLSNQTIEKPLQYWGYSMADEKFSEKLYYFNNETHLTIPLLRPASFIISNKKIFIDDAHFFDLLQKKSIEIKGSVREIIEKGIIFENKAEIQEFDGIILCTGFSHGREQFFDDASQY